MSIKAGIVHPRDCTMYVTYVVVFLCSPMEFDAPLSLPFKVSYPLCIERFVLGCKKNYKVYGG